jgi:hypothetical protein
MSEHKNSKAAKIREYLRANPTATPKEVAAKCGTNPQHVSVIKNDMRKKGEYVQPAKQNLPTVAVTPRPPSDPVNHPAHYKVGGIETIDFIEAKRLNYNLGNAVKYVTRADHKGSRKQDLEKAIWYLKRELEHSL